MRASTMRASSGRPTRSTRCAIACRMLKIVTFQKDLGSYYDKTVRVASWEAGCARIAADRVARSIGQRLHKAALLAKTDLTTELVKEFTELQGIVGGLYAKVQGSRRPTVAQRDLRSLQAGVDGRFEVPRTPEGAVLSIADKADTIAGMFALGLDPEWLERSVCAAPRRPMESSRSIAEHKLPVSLSELMSQDAREAIAARTRRRSSRRDYVRRDRRHISSANGWSSTCARLLGFAYDVVNAVLAAGCG